MSKVKIGSPENIIGASLREARKALKLTQAEFAKPLSISGSYVSDIEKGKATPSGAVVREIVEEYRINRERLEGGQGELFASEELRGKPRYLVEGTHDEGVITASAKQAAGVNLTEDDFVRVPRYEVAASAGGGALVQSEQIVDHLAFKAEWLKVSLGVTPGRVAVISVIGDSMEPYLAEGDLIMVDLGVDRVSNDAVYVLQYDDSLLVKRIQRKQDGTVIVKSDNPQYEPEIFNGDAAGRLRVVGRMLRRLVR